MAGILKYYLGTVPRHCNICSDELEDVFYDAKTIHGYWAIMCDRCFIWGPGLDKLGEGFGQEYTKQADGIFLKTGG